MADRKKFCYSLGRLFPNSQISGLSKQVLHVVHKKVCFCIIKTRNTKYLLLGDMLELGNYSKKLHESIAPLINQTKIDKVFVKGKMASLIYKKISNSKKGKILINNSQIDDLIRNDIKNNDYLMIKASLATGFNKIVNEIKGLN